MEAEEGNEIQKLLQVLQVKHELLSRSKETISQTDSLSIVIIDLATQYEMHEFACEATLNQAYYNRKQVKMAEALQQYELAVEIAVKHNFDHLKADGQNGIGVIHFYRGNYLLALDYYQKALASYIQVADSSSISKSYNNIAIIYSNQEDYDKAVHYYEQSIELLRKVKPINQVRLGKRLYNLTLAHNRVGNYEAAERSCRELIRLDKATGEQATVLESIGLLVEIIGKQGQLRRATSLADSIYKAATDLADPYLSSLALIRKGWAFQDNEKYDSALRMYDQGKGILGFSFEEDYEYYKNKAEVLLLMGNYHTAAENARLGIAVANEFGYKKWLFYLYELLYKSEFKLGDYKSAYSSLNTHYAYRDSLWDEEKAVELGRLQSQIELNQAKAANDKLTAIGDLKDSTIGKQQAVIIAISMLILLMGIFAVILRRQLIVRKKLTEKIASQSEKLQALDQAKTRFFTNISHDFRSPLSMIKGSIDAVKQIENGILQEDSKMMLDMGKENCERLLYLAEEIMDLTKLEQDKIQLKTQKIEVATYFNSFITIFSKEAERKSVEFAFEQELTGPTWLMIDTKQFDKVVYNLLSNAIKFTPKQGLIKVKLATENQSLHAIFYNTTTKNLSQEKLDGLFNRYAQDDRHINYSAGAGIGLSLAKELVELHKGQIEAKGHDGGINFIVQLPLVVERSEIVENLTT